MAFTYTIREDGRLMKRVSVKGRLKSIYSDNPKDLERQYIDLKYKLNNNINIENEITFKYFATEWLEIHSAGKSDGTIREYKYIVNNYLIKNLGNLKLKVIKKYDIQKIQKQLLENGHQELAQKVIRFAKSILNEAVECDYINKNIAMNIKSPKIIRKDKQILTKEEDNLLIECANTHKHGLFFLLLRYSGMRKEEIVALEVNNIDLENKTILINKAVNFIHNQAKLKTANNSNIPTTKSKKSREVPILDIVYDMLEKRIKYCKSHNIKYVFTKQTKPKGMLSDTAIRRMLESSLLYINKLNKEKHKDDENKDNLKEIYFTLHQLRHSYCTMLYYAGIKIKEAQSLMGHASADMVYDIYTHLDLQKEDTLNSLNSYLNSDTV